MSVKLALTFTDANGLIHAGLDVERWTEIVEVENEKLEELLKPYIKQTAKYSSCSISIIKEEKDEGIDG